MIADLEGGVFIFIGTHRMEEMSHNLLTNSVQRSITLKQKDFIANGVPTR
jgi:hypothetical protein